MIISLPKKEFAQAVHIVARFAEKGNATLPALSAILLVVGGDGIKLRATNLETGIDLEISGDKKEDGVVAIPASLLAPIAASLSGEGTLTLTHSGDTAVITTGSAKSTIKTIPYEDFPIIPVPETKTTLSLPGITIKNLLSSIAACASTSTVRPELASIYLVTESGALTAVATDSFRLAEKKVSLTKAPAHVKVLIPAKNALDIAQALPDEEVQMTMDEHQCSFTWGKSRLVSRLTNANYPDYKQIIPKEVAAEATVLRKDLEFALRRTAIFSDQFQKIKLSFDAKKKALALYATNPNLGESSETIPANISGNNLDLSFNHRYLAAALPLITTESLTLSAAGVGRPLTIRGQGDASFLYLVSPMNQ